MALLKKISTIAAMLAVITIITTGCLGGGTRPLGWSGVAASGDDLYFATRDGTLYSIDNTNGNTRWQYTLEKAQGVYAAPLVVDDSVYVSTYGGWILALNTAGTLKWTYPADNKLADAVVSGLAYGDDKLFYGSDDGYVYALDAGSGTKIWEFETGKKIWATPVIENGVLYIGSFDNNFYALSADTGEELWNFEADGVFTSAAVIEGNTIFFGSLDRNLYALDKNTGAQKWIFTADRWFWTTPVILDGVVYAPNTDNTVYAVDAVSGDLLKRYDLTAPISSSPVVMDGKIVVAAQDGVISIIDPAAGEIELLAELEVTVRASLTASGDVVYVHSQTNEAIYALNIITKAQIWLHSVQ